MGTGANETKANLRAHYRALRRSIDDRAARSESIWRFVTELAEYRSARAVMLFDSIPGEPETAGWQADVIASGRDLYIPEQDDHPAHIDVVVVPGLAFTESGERLGQGGGWYDRFLARTSAAAIIGVCFEIQLADSIPVEPHDVVMTHVVTERGICAHIHTPS